MASDVIEGSAIRAFYPQEREYLGGYGHAGTSNPSSI